jgi:serine/threonine protein kinase
MPIEKEVVEKEWIDGKERIVLNGDIVLSERISDAGKMSNGVYLATGRRLDKNWAVKVVNKTPSENGVNYAECVRDEARVLRKLEHPSIVRVTDVLQDQQAVYVVMDYIEGETLQERVMREGPQPQELVLEWAKQIADALGYVHSQFGDDGMPLVHRDLKAENIMVRPDNSVRVIDFGIAHIAGFGTGLFGQFAQLLNGGGLRALETVPLGIGIGHGIAGDLGFGAVIEIKRANANAGRYALALNTDHNKRPFFGVQWDPDWLFYTTKCSRKQNAAA